MSLLHLVFVYPVLSLSLSLVTPGVCLPCTLTLTHYTWCLYTLYSHTTLQLHLMFVYPLLHLMFVYPLLLLRLQVWEREQELAEGMEAGR